MIINRAGNDLCHLFKMILNLHLKKFELMENINLKDLTIGLIKGYMKSRAENILTHAADRFSSFASRLIAGFFLFACICCTVFFASFTAAFSLSDYFGKPYIGFLAVCGFYLLLGLIIWWQRERLIKRPLNNLLMILVREKVK